MSLATTSLTALESFNPIATQAGWGQGRVRPKSGPVTQLAATMSPYSQQANYGKIIEQLQHYTYWNYVAVKLIANRSSEPTPMLSFKTKMGGKKSSIGDNDTEDIDSASVKSSAPHYSKQQRAWLQSKYNVFQSSQDDLDPIPETHPLAALICNPNDEDTWNQFAFEHFLFLELTGQVYWWVIPNGFGLPSQVAVIPTQWVRPDIDANGNIYQYSVLPDGGAYRLLELPPEQVAFGMLKNPRNKRHGYSPIEAAPYWTANSESIEVSRNASFNQGVNPDVILKLGEKYADPDDAVITRIKEKFMKRASGVRRAGEPIITPPDIDVLPWSHAPKDMDYGTTGDIARDSNLALHNVPKVLLGITTDVNRATVEGANVVFCENKINPGLTHFAGMLTKHLAKPYDPRIVVWFDDVTPRNQELELQQDQVDFAIGALTPDEQRQKRGRKAIGEPAYTSGYLPAGLHPISEEMAQIASDREAESMAAEAEMLASANSQNNPQGNGNSRPPAKGSGGAKKPAKAATAKAGKTERSANQSATQSATQSALPTLGESIVEQTLGDLFSSEE